MKFIYNFKKGFLIFLSIFSISLFSLILFGTIKSSSVVLGDLNTFYTENRVTLVFNEQLNKKVFEENLIELCKDGNVIASYASSSDTDLAGNGSQGLYFTGEFKPSFNILEGRMLNKDDMQSSEKLAVVGADFYNLIYFKNNEKYINLKNSEFRVVGIIGMNNTVTSNKGVMYNDLVLYNIKSLDDSAIISGGVDINSYKYSQEELKNKIINEVDSNIIGSIYMIGEVFPEKNITALALNRHIISSFILIIICFMCTLIKGLSFWIDRISLELGVRKSFGANNKNILFIILKRYTTLFSLATTLALITGIIFNKLRILNNINLSIDMDILMFILILYVILLVISLFIIYIKIIKLNIRSIIRS